MSLVRETGREEKASIFHDTRESLPDVSMFRDVGEGLCASWLSGFLEGMGAHVRVERLKAERVRKSLLVTMARCWGFKYGGDSNGCVSRGYPSLIDYVIQ